VGGGIPTFVYISFVVLGVAVPDKLKSKAWWAITKFLYPTKVQKRPWVWVGILLSVIAAVSWFVTRQMRYNNFLQFKKVGATKLSVDGRTDVHGHHSILHREVTRSKYTVKFPHYCKSKIFGRSILGELIGTPYDLQDQLRQLEEDPCLCEEKEETIYALDEHVVQIYPSLARVAEPDQISRIVDNSLRGLATVNYNRVEETIKDSFKGTSIILRNLWIRSMTRYSYLNQSQELSGSELRLRPGFQDGSLPGAGSGPIGGS
jgi:hypothetical protein